MFFVMAIMMVATLVISYRALNQSHTAPDAQEPKAPVIEEGKPLGVVFGRVKISSGSVYWWGDLTNEEIKK